MGTGGGGLNILPHKSWNVYNRENRLKVKRDEAEAAARERSERHERILAESRERRKELRRRNRQDEDEDEDDEEEDAREVRAEGETFKHENFFEEEEKLMAKQAREQRAKRPPEENLEILRFATSTYKKQKPWYAVTSSQAQEHAGPSNLSLPARIRREREEVERAKLAKQRPTHASRPSSSAAPARPCPTASPPVTTCSVTKAKLVRGKKSVQQLREERLARESEEGKKAQRLIASHRAEHSRGPQKEFYSAFGYAPARERRSRWSR